MAFNLHVFHCTVLLKLDNAFDAKIVAEWLLPTKTSSTPPSSISPNTDIKVHENAYHYQ
tara:strand:- start:214 stop:390 length:177 start_codon:yes stop_codon:yes gene_type:complete